MTRVFTFGRGIEERNYTIPDLRAVKGSDKRLSVCNPANTLEAKACTEAGIDLLSIWDKHVPEIRAACGDRFIIAGGAWSEYATPDDILRASIECLTSGADMVYTARGYDIVEMLANEGIPVQVHIGLMPSRSIWNGGLRALGKTAEEALEIFRVMKRYESAGAVAAEVECVAENALQSMNDKTTIFTISLGSGNAGDAVFVFMADLCGETDNPPRHAHTFRNLAPMHARLYEERVAALREYHAEVHAKQFPYESQNAFMGELELEKLQEALDRT